MNARSLGMLAVGISVLLGAAAARADETHGARASERKELSGTIIKSDSDTLYLEHMGAVVPIEVTRSTSFSGIRSASELSEGQEVRASFTVKDDTRNVADRISLGMQPQRRELPSWPDRTEDHGG